MKLFNLSKQRKQKLFKRFLISYIAIMLVPLMISVLVYGKVVSTMQEDAQKGNLAMLQQTRDIMDRQLAEVDAVLMQLVSNGRIDRISSSYEITKEGVAYDVLEIAKQLSTYCSTNNFISKIIVFFHRSNSIVSPDGTSQLSYSYNRFFKYSNMEYEEWYDKVLNKYHYKEYLPSRSIKLFNDEKQRIAYIQSIPVDSRKVQGTILVTIDEEQVHKLFENYVLGQGGDAYILDDRGQVIASKTGFGEEVFKIKPDSDSGYMHQMHKGRDLLVSYTKSQYNGWTYVAAVPSRAVMAKINYFKIMMVAVVLLSAAISISLSYYLAGRNIKPIRNIISLIGEKFGVPPEDSRNEYEVLSTAITRLVENDERLTKSMQESIPLLQASFIRRLLIGDFSDMGKINTMVDQLNLKLFNKNYLVLLVKVNGYSGSVTTSDLEELNKVKLIIKDGIRAIYEHAYPVDISDDQIAYVVTLEEEAEEDCKARVEKIADIIEMELCRPFNIKLTFAAGKLYSTLMDMFYSYREANQALEQGIRTGSNTIIWYSDEAVRSGYYYHPLDLQVRIVNLAKAGAQEEIDKILDMLYIENHIKSVLSRNTSQLLLNEIKGTILKSLEHISIENAAVSDCLMTDVYTLDFGSLVETKYGNVKLLYARICSIVAEQKQSNNVRLKEDIEEYIRVNYVHQDLSRHSVAAQFNLSEDYLSRFFKEQLGENFSDYVERLRIEKASELLKCGKSTVEDIALKVGYNSATSFRRAFKRSTGVSPAAFKA